MSLNTSRKCTNTFTCNETLARPSDTVHWHHITVITLYPSTDTVPRWRHYQRLYYFTLTLCCCINCTVPWHDLVPYTRSIGVTISLFYSCIYNVAAALGELFYYIIWSRLVQHKFWIFFTLLGCLFRCFSHVFMLYPVKIKVYCHFPGITLYDYIWRTFYTNHQMVFAYF